MEKHYVEDWFGDNDLVSTMFEVLWRELISYMMKVTAFQEWEASHE